MKDLGKSIAKALKKALSKHGLKLGATRLETASHKTGTSLVIYAVATQKKKARKK